MSASSAKNAVVVMVNREKERKSNGKWRDESGEGRGLAQACTAATESPPRAPKGVSSSMSDSASACVFSGSAGASARAPRPPSET
eukprot:996322-Pleurochrysis_carterae.AAC.1